VSPHGGSNEVWPEYGGYRLDKLSLRLQHVVEKHIAELTDLNVTNMSSRMRAARYYGKEDVRIVNDLERPTVSEGQVKVEPAFVGICGTDLHEFMGGPK
jgi:hypothetical protein